jgi:regulator of sigma E protease
MMQILLFVIGVILFIGLVIVHEAGHFFVARRNGVKAEEFGLGFPPRAWSKHHKDGTTFSLNWLPLGGFVKLKGEFDADTRRGAFGSASLWVKSKILLAGVTMNLLVGLVLLTILAAVGLPVLITEQTVGQDQFTVTSDTKVVKSQVFAGYIEPSSPASRIGLSNRDIITEVKGAGSDFKIGNIDNLHQATQALAGKKVSISYIHNNQNITKEIKLRTIAVVAASRKSNNPKGYLGVSPLPLQVRRSTWSAPVVAVGFTTQLVQLTLKGLGHALSGLSSAIAGLVTGNHQARQNGTTQAESQVGGPVAIVAILWGYGALGLNFIVLIIAVISLTLALMNILPIPALDGGRLAMILTSRGLFRKPLSRMAEERLTATGMVFLLVLIALITLVDVKRFL